MADFTIKQHDTLPALVLTLTDASTTPPTVVDLTSATEVRVLIRNPAGTLVVNRTTTGTSQGIVTYAWQAADTAVAQTLQGEVQVTWTGGGIQTFRPGGYFTVVVVPDLGP